MHTANVVSAWTLSAHDALVAAAREVDLEFRELAALTLIHEHDGCSVDWLRHRIGLTQSGTVRLVDRLEERGLVTRTAAAGRGVPLGVSSAGHQRLSAWQQARQAVTERLLEGLPAGKRRAVVSGMAGALRADTRQRLQADATCRTCCWADCGDDCPVDGSVAPAP
jgi:DNA-binding MarR family transcriptional regulator